MAVPAEKEKEEPKPWYKRAWAIFVGIGVGLTVITGVITNYEKLRDFFDPEYDPSPLREVKVVKNRVDIERGVTLGDYLERRQLDRNGYTNLQLTASGAIVTTNIGIEGLRGQTCVIYFEYYKADEGRAIPNTWFKPEVREPSLRTVDHVPQLDKEQWVYQSWVPYPEYRSSYFLRVWFYAQHKDGNWQRHEYMDSDKFEASALPQGIPPPPLVPGTPQAPDVNLPPPK